MLIIALCPEFTDEVILLITKSQKFHRLFIFLVKILRQSVNYSRSVCLFGPRVDVARALQLCALPLWRGCEEESKNTDVFGFRYGSGGNNGGGPVLEVEKGNGVANLH